ncbi:TTC33 protein, partial [Polyodon spathula]|nr:TTC33 protein [Polyodon spathula]
MCFLNDFVAVPLPSSLERPGQDATGPQQPLHRLLRGARMKTAQPQLLRIGPTPAPHPGLALLPPSPPKGPQEAPGLVPQERGLPATKKGAGGQETSSPSRTFMVGGTVAEAPEEGAASHEGVGGGGPPTMATPTDYSRPLFRDFQTEGGVVCPLWEEDLSWALKLRDLHRAAEEAARLEEEAEKQLLAAPELIPDYDFESDKVVAACVAIAERQKQAEKTKKTTIIMTASSSVETVSDNKDSKTTPADQQFIKARLLDH